MVNQSKFLSSNNPVNETTSGDRHHIANESKFLDGKMLNNLQPKLIFSEELKIRIQTVLSRRVNGMYAARFPFEFKALYKEEFDLTQTAFKSVVHLMEKLPKIVDITKPTEKGDWLLKPKVLHYNEFSPGEVNEDIEISLSYIVDPSLFWVQITTYLDDLNELMDEMSNFYYSEATKYQLHNELIVPGQPCAALYEDDQWYRAVIQEVISADEVCVYYVDYGNEDCVEISSLCLLKDDFFKLPCQAFEAKLDGVKQSEEKWSKQSIEMFYKHTCDQQLHAKIVEKKPVLSLHVTDVEKNSVALLIEDGITNNLSLDSVYHTDRLPSSPDHLEHSHILTASTPSTNPLPNSHVTIISEESNKNPAKQVCPECEFVKSLHISDDFTLHVIRVENTPCVVSAEISSLFWEFDILEQMLHQKNSKIESKVLVSDENAELFAAIQNYPIQSLMNEGSTKKIFRVYELTLLPAIFLLFKSKYENVKEVVMVDIKSWSNLTREEQYWSCSEEDAVCKEQDVETLLKQQALMFRRKRLYQMIFVNDHIATDCT